LPEKLQAMEIRLYLVSGDGCEATEAVGQNVEIRECPRRVVTGAKGGISQRASKRKSPCCHGGDGINDAPALDRLILASVSRHSNDLGKEQAASP